MKIHVSIVDYFKAPRLIESLKALERQSLFSSCQVTVFDNSVDDDNFNRLNEYISQKSNIALVRSSHNRGYTRRQIFPSIFPPITWCCLILI